MLPSESERQMVYTLCIFTTVFYFSEGYLSRSARQAEEPEWGYDPDNGPERWSRLFPVCGGQRQSPIDISPNSVQGASLPPLQYYGYWESMNGADTTNTGETVRITLDRRVQPFLRGGPLQGDYTFAQLHFHWGPNDSVGSEHTLYGKRFTMEAHLVHFKRQYGSFERAMNYSDGIAVVAFFIQAMDSWDNPLFEDLSDDVYNLVEPLSTSEISQFDATEWFHSYAAPYGYFTYNGSLTTPGCAESVIWIIYPAKIFVGSDQVEPFRHIESESGEDVTRNFRTIQPTNNRKILFSTPPSQRRESYRRDRFRRVFGK